MKTTNDMKIVGVLMIVTGLAAIVCSVYSWGKGLIFTMPFDLDTSIIVGDLFFTAPLSLLGGVLYFMGKKIGMVLALMAAGTYLFGSIQVYSVMLHNGSPYPLSLAIPPIGGTCVALMILVVAHIRQDRFS